MNISKYRVTPKKKMKLEDYPTEDTGKFKSKKEAEKIMQKNIKKMAELQDVLYAHNKYALLIIFQAMDAAGKDGAIKHVMSGVNPQGTQVFSFKQPSAEEMDHDYLWRINKSLPERGRIGIFNRSYYEEVLVVRVHNVINKTQLPEKFITENIWVDRFRQLRDYEKYLHENGVVVLKFFLHISKDEQKRRFLKRLEDSTKNWKFSASDLKERAKWEDYQTVYEDAMAETSTKNGYWYVIPMNHKWYGRYVISEVIVQTLKNLDMEYPKMNEEQMKNLNVYKEKLTSES